MSYRRPLVLSVSAALAVTFTAAALHASAQPTVAPAAAMAPTVLTTDVVHGLSGLLADSAHVSTPAASVLTLGVSVADPDPAAIQSFINATADPKSPDYKQFLTPDEFHTRFGPTQATVDAVSGWLSGGGLIVHAQPGTYGYLTATGTVADIGALMKTSFATFTSSGLIANTTAPTVPAAVLGVAGLNTGTHPRATDPVHQAPSTRADSPPIGELSPMDLWDIYDQPAADEGQGQGLALFGYGTLDDGAGHTILSDMRQFEAEYALPQIPYYASYFSSAPGEKATETDGFDEWTLDAQAADGMAPKAAKLVDYFATLGTDADIVGSYAQWANDPNGPLQGSSSFGDCEDVPGTDAIGASALGSVLYLGNPAQDQYAAVYAQAAAEGRTLFAASGDTQACPTVAVAMNGVTPVPVPIQDYPGVDTNVVGVGGTIIYFNGKTATTPASRITEYPWEFSGGGQSHFIPAPAAQAAAVQPVDTTGSATAAAGLPVDPFLNLTDHHGNVYATPMPARIQPDVAALSGDVTGDGYTITASGVNDSFGAGTSLASPLWLGMWARIQAAAPAASDGTHRGLGFAQPVIYKLATGATSYLDNYYDDGSVSETPPSIPNSNGGLGTSPGEGGYDTQTGWGSPDVAHFITSATGSTTFTPTDPTGGAGVPAADQAATPTPISAPVTKPSTPAPAKVTPSCSVRASAVALSGPAKVVLGRFKSQLYTFKLTVKKGSCKTPSNVGRQLRVYVNGRLESVIRTGKGGVQKYLVRLRPGTDKITATFVGNRDLKRSSSRALRAHVVG